MTNENPSSKAKKSPPTVSNDDLASQKKALEESIKTMTGDLLSKESMNNAINRSDLDPEVAKAAMSSVTSIAGNAASVDETQLHADSATSKTTIEALKDALNKAETKEERESILDRIDKADERQKRNSAAAGSRNANTQRGAMMVIHGLVIVAAGAAVVAGAALLERFKS